MVTPGAALRCQKAAKQGPAGEGSRRGWKLQPRSPVQPPGTGCFALRTPVWGKSHSHLYQRGMDSPHLAKNKHHCPAEEDAWLCHMG